MTSHLYNDAESGSRGGSLAIVLLVGLVWIAMLAGDWWMRFAWYHWQTTLTARPIVAEGPDAPLVRQEVKETRGGDLTGLLGIPALARRFEQTRSATLNLSDEYGFRNIPPVKNRYFPLVAVGSSYIVAGETMSNTFSAALSRASGRDVYCYGWAARGPLFSVIRFLGDERFATNPPRVMVWGLVEREIGGDMLAELVKRLKGLNEEPLGAGVPGGRRIAWSVLAPRSVQKSLPASSVIAHLSHRAWNGIRYYVFGQLGPDVCFAVRPVGGKPVLMYKWAIEAMKWTPDQRKPAKVVETLKFLDSFCKARGIKLVVMLIPDKEQVYRDRLPPEMDTPESPIPDSTLNAVEAGLRREGVPVVNLLGPFRERACEDVLLYWADDTHWNSEGIELAARCVWKEIEEKRLLGSP